MPQLITAPTGHPDGARGGHGGRRCGPYSTGHAAFNDSHPASTSWITVLATFVIGLREGLEAALIIGIIAAFLRGNGKRLTAMWLGVIAAIVLSVCVGVGLKLVERALPQAAQEGLETIIGVIAVVFVTGMILWMNTHAHGMKRELEGKAAQALGQAGARALALMAFLAVLKEGFETSVFLLATFSVAQSATLAAVGAVLGLLVAGAIGWGIYAGSVRINLSRFFRLTGGFLILVAAGLVISALRTAHEAGWLNAGQQATVSLAWLVAPGTIQSALITGVLGIPADPRVIEVLGWLAYLVPVALVIYWPRSSRPGPRTAALLRLGLAGALALAALGLVVAYPVPHATVPTSAPIVKSNGSEAAIGTVSLLAPTGGVPTLVVSRDGSTPRSIPLSHGKRHDARHLGTAASAWTLTDLRRPHDAPSTLGLQQVVALAGGRLPVGLDPQRNPGPFTADWASHRKIEVWTAGNVLLDAHARSRATVTLSGGGLQTPRTLAVTAPATDPSASGWKVADTYRDHAAAALHGLAAARSERAFWAKQLPLALLALALALASFAARRLIRPGPRAAPVPDSRTPGP